MHKIIYLLLTNKCSVNTPKHAYLLENLKPQALKCILIITQREFLTTRNFDSKYKKFIFAKLDKKNNMLQLNQIISDTTNKEVIKHV